MKGITQSIAILVILCFLILAPTGFSKTEKSELSYNSLSLISGFESSAVTLDYKRVLINGVWWIYVYDNGKLIDVYPE